MLTRDVLLTFAEFEFYSPKWSPKIRCEWEANLIRRLSERTPDCDAAGKVAAIVGHMSKAFPDAEIASGTVNCQLSDPSVEKVHENDRHVVMAAIACGADAIITANERHFAAETLKTKLSIEVIHPDEFIMDLITLSEPRAIRAFKELRARKKNPPWDVETLVSRLIAGGLTQTSTWVGSKDISALI